MDTKPSKCQNPSCPKEATEDCQRCEEITCLECAKEFHSTYTCSNCGKIECIAHQQSGSISMRKDETGKMHITEDNSIKCFRCHISSDFE